MVFVLYKKDKNKHKNKKTNQKHEIMKNLTQVVRDEQKLKLMNFIDYLPALIVNIFKDSSIKGYEYENAGDIYFVVTDDTVYFEEQRHF